MVNKDNMRKATEALRSGKYEQAEGALREGNAFCALGVICDTSGVGQWAKSSKYSIYAYTTATDRSAGSLPNDVLDWLGLDALLPNNALPLHDEDGTVSDVLTLNDDLKYNFDRIAALIEKEYEL